MAFQLNLHRPGALLTTTENCSEKRPVARIKILIETYELDLNQVAQLPLTAVRLITASALFDLVSAPFIDRLIAEVDEASAGRPVGIYAALNYDGSTCWDPVHPLRSAGAGGIQ